MCVSRVHPRVWRWGALSSDHGANVVGVRRVEQEVVAPVLEALDPSLGVCARDALELERGVLENFQVESGRVLLVAVDLRRETQIHSQPRRRAGLPRA